MNQSVQIIMTIPVNGTLLKNFVQKIAEELGLEGLAHAAGTSTVKIIAHGSPESIDDFIDALYEGHGATKPDMVAVEPYMQNKDFRGMFRII